MVLPRVPGHPTEQTPVARGLAAPGSRVSSGRRFASSLWVHPILWVHPPIAPGSDHEGAGSGQDPVGISGPIGVPIGELHAPVQPGTLPSHQILPRLEEPFGPGDAQRGQTGPFAHGPQIGYQRLGHRGVRCLSWVWHGHVPCLHERAHVRSLRGSSHFAGVAATRDEACLLEQTDGPGLISVDHHLRRHSRDRR